MVSAHLCQSLAFFTATLTLYPLLPTFTQSLRPLPHMCELSERIYNVYEMFTCKMSPRQLAPKGSLNKYLVKQLNIDIAALGLWAAI